MKRPAPYIPRHTTTPLPVVVAETRAFSLLVAQTKRGNPNGPKLLRALFGEHELGQVA